MRKIVVTTMVTIDGVMQAPDGPENGFKYGGWTAPYWDEAAGNTLDEELSVSFDLMLGKKTYELFAPYWPKQSGSVADPFNKAKKYVVSDTAIDLTWSESILIDGDVVAKIKALKEEDGPMIQVHGSGVLVQTLLKNDLVDELRLRIFPITLGAGQRLFGDGTIPAAFEVLKSEITPNGIMLISYKKVGKPQTGIVT